MIPGGISASQHRSAASFGHESESETGLSLDAYAGLGHESESQSQRNRETETEASRLGVAILAIRYPLWENRGWSQIPQTDNQMGIIGRTYGLSSRWYRKNTLTPLWLSRQEFPQASVDNQGRRLRRFSYSEWHYQTDWDSWQVDSAWSRRIWTEWDSNGTEWTECFLVQGWLSGRRNI